MKRRTPAHRFALSLLLFFLVLFVMTVLGAILDDPRSAQASADDAAQAVVDAQQQAADDEHWRRMCRAELGPGAQLLRTPDGDMVCRPATQVASKGGAL